MAGCPSLDVNTPYLQSSAQARRAPPPGQLVDVGGHRLHIHCLGTGSPAVILKAGLGDHSQDWSLVQAELARHTTVCASDRAGLGRSDPSCTPPTSDQVARSLHALLTNAGIPPPYVLVGHSVAGIHVRAFARPHPDDVAGMVLVDSSHENPFIRFPDEIVQAEQDNEDAPHSRLTHHSSLPLLCPAATCGIIEPYPYTQTTAQEYNWNKTHPKIVNIYGTDAASQERAQSRRLPCSGLWD